MAPGIPVSQVRGWGDIRVRSGLAGEGLLLFGRENVFCKEVRPASEAVSQASSHLPGETRGTYLVSGRRRPRRGHGKEDRCEHGEVLRTGPAGTREAAWGTQPTVGEPWTPAHLTPIQPPLSERAGWRLITNTHENQLLRWSP